MNFFKALDVYYKHWGKDQTEKKLDMYSKDQLNKIIHNVFKEDIRDIQDEDFPHHKREFMFYLLFELEDEIHGTPLSKVFTKHIKNLTETLLSNYGMEFEKKKHSHTDRIQNRLDVSKGLFHEALFIHFHRDIYLFEDTERKMLDNIRSVDAIICLF
jgi:hypothetical protein